jgi:hypothetical protein
MALVAAAVTFLAAPCAFAHEHWIDVETFYPEVGDSVGVYLCGGHYFPKSEMAVKDNVIDAFGVRCGSDSLVTIPTVREKKRRTGVLAVASAGVHVLTLTLKRPKANDPSFEAKALVVVDPTTDSPERYVLGQGLELAPHASLSGLEPGDELPISLILDGTPIPASLEVVPEKGKTLFLRAETDAPAVIRLRKAGRYLVTAHVGGRGCSLVLQVPGAEED